MFLLAFIIFYFASLIYFTLLGWLGSRVVSVLDSGAEEPGFNRAW